MYQRGSSAIIISTGQSLNGVDLKTYIEQMLQGLSMTRCLAAEAAADKAGKSATGK